MCDKKVVVDYLYLDLNTCQRCVGTDQVLEEVLSELAPAFELAGYDIIYNLIEIENAAMAEEYKFVSSPTVRVNGNDICETVQENNCGCCGEISGTEVNCRVFEYEGKLYEVPPKEMLAEAVLKYAFVKAEADGDYTLPDNLKQFFEGKQKKTSCCCGGNDCCNNGESSMTKLYVFTGFLGSGKTTLLSELMRKLEGKRIGVIQNEFGKLGIDGEILNQDGIEMIEINKGSIFCSCLKLQFVDALAQMAEKDFEYLFVESSGLGDPSNVEEILNVVKAAKGKEFDFAGILCLVDAVNFLEQVADEETVNRQLKHCHMAVISKTDLVDDAQVAALEAKIREINPICRIEISQNGNLPADFMDDDLMQYQWAENEDSLNSPESKPKTLIMNFKEPFSRSAFEAFMNEVKKDLYRAKGFVELEGEGWHQIDVVGQRIDYKPCDPKEAPRMTIISRIGPGIIKPIVMNWKTIVKTGMELKN